MAYHIPDHRLSALFSRSRLFLSVCGLLLAGLLTACGLGSGSTGTTPTTTSGNTPKTSHATSVPVQPTSAPSVSLTTYSALPHGKSCVVRFNLLFSSDSALVCPPRLQGHSSALEQEKHMAFVREKEEDVA